MPKRYDPQTKKLLFVSIPYLFVVCLYECKRKKAWTVQSFLPPSPLIKPKSAHRKQDKKNSPQKKQATLKKNKREIQEKK